MTFSTQRRLMENVHTVTWACLLPPHTRTPLISHSDLGRLSVHNDLFLQRIVNARLPASPLEQTFGAPRDSQ